MIVSILGGFVAMLVSFVVGRRLRPRPVSGRTEQRPAGERDAPAQQVSPPPVPVHGVTVLRGQQRLEQAYKELRERPHLTKVQAIWSAAYNDIDIMAYFQEESAWLAAHPHVAIERLVIGQPEVMIDELGLLAKRHEKFRLFTHESDSQIGNQFEVYLCEYTPPENTSSMSGILVLNSHFSHRPELGIQIDSAEVGQFVYVLRGWFENWLDSAVAGPTHMQDVWTLNSGAYDDFVRRDAKQTFLRDYIAQEDAFLEELIMNQGGDVSLLDFGSGTGRTFEYLRSKSSIRGKVALFIGFDHSKGMVSEAQRKRDANRSNAWDRTFYFLLDGAHAGDAFWNGRVRLDSSMDDISHLSREHFAYDRYEESDKIITCLLNTLGVVDAGTREAMLRNMFTAAGRQDQVAVSVFARDAFTTHARELYPFMKDIVTEGEILPECYNDDAAEFRAGYYYSHWFDKDEIEQLVIDAGGDIIAVRDFTSDGAVIGRMLVARRRD